MTEIVETALRHYCRNPRCRSKLPVPVSNSREAFCVMGCYRSFYLHRCLVCEEPIKKPKRGVRLLCKKAKCRNAWRTRIGIGRYVASSDAKLSSKEADFIGSKQPLRTDRPWRIVVGPKLTAAELRCATVPDGADCRWEGGEYRRLEARNRAALRNRFAEQAGKCLIQPHHSPVNFLGGYKFADARSMCHQCARLPRKLGCPIIDDSLDIPGFLRRSLSDMTNLTRAKDAVACFHRDRRASPARAAQPIRRPPVRQN
jgi:hypothetical protein